MLRRFWSQWIANKVPHLQILEVKHLGQHGFLSPDIVVFISKYFLHLTRLDYNGYYNQGNSPSLHEVSRLQNLQSLAVLEYELDTNAIEAITAGCPDIEFLDFFSTPRGLMTTQ